MSFSVNSTFCDRLYLFSCLQVWNVHEQLSGPGSRRRPLLRAAAPAHSSQAESGREARSGESPGNESHATASLGPPRPSPHCGGFTVTGTLLLSAIYHPFFNRNFETSSSGGLKRGRNSREEEKDWIRRRERKKGNKETVIWEAVILVPIIPVFDFRSPVRSS